MERIIEFIVEQGRPVLLTVKFIRVVGVHTDLTSRSGFIAIEGLTSINPFIYLLTDSCHRVRIVKPSDSTYQVNSRHQILVGAVVSL